MKIWSIPSEPDLGGQMAIPPYVSWLVELSMIWSEEQVKNFTRKLVALSGGRLRYSEEERVVSGEFPIAANMGGATEQMWQWQAKGAPLMAVMGSTPVLPSYFQLGVPKNSAHPNLVEALRRLYGLERSPSHPRKIMIFALPTWSKERAWRSICTKIKSASRAKDSINFYLQGEDSGLQFKEELTKMLKQ